MDVMKDDMQIVGVKGKKCRRQAERRGRFAVATPRKY